MVFIKKDITDNLEFTPKNFEYFVGQIPLKDSPKNQIWKILEESKRLPAALRGYHGPYGGGLFDHTLLVTNFVYQIRDNPKILENYIDWLEEKRVDVSDNYNDLDLPKAIQTAIYHDFGKVPYYGFKKKLKIRRIYTNIAQRQEASREIKKKWKYRGNDSHVDECIAVLKRYYLPFDDEICQAIIFHHGKWSKYKPFEPTKLSELIHVADMIASQFYKI